jgi:hypothetical protein
MDLYLRTLAGSVQTAFVLVLLEVGLPRLEEGTECISNFNCRIRTPRHTAEDKQTGFLSWGAAFFLTRTGAPAGFRRFS